MSATQAHLNRMTQGEIALHRQGVEVRVAVDSHQQVHQQLLKARGYHRFRWLGCQLQLLWPILKALMSYKIWSDWARIPGEAWTVLKTRRTRAELLRCCLVSIGSKGVGGAQGY